MKKVLEIEGLKKSFKKRVVVEGVSFKVKQGQVVGLLGPNGAGKTTTFYMTVGLTRPDAGRILLNGKDITNCFMYERACMGLGYLPQEPSIFRKLTVYQNIFAALEAQKLDLRLCRQHTEALLEEFSLASLASSYGMTLSGGERRRVEIARALAMDPHFLLLDEPFAGIDPIAVGEIQEFISLLKKRGVGVLITDHNVRETLKICDWAYIILSGRIQEQGSPQEIAKSAKARDNYLGKDFQL